MFKTKEAFNEYRNRWTKERRQWIDSLKTGPCADCGRTYPPYVMQFDHLPEHDKSFTIAKHWQYSKKRLLEEIKKCELVCANCHAERTHNRAPVFQSVEKPALEAAQ